MLTLAILLRELTLINIEIILFFINNWPCFKGNVTTAHYTYSIMFYQQIKSMPVANNINWM